MGAGRVRGVGGSAGLGGPAAAHRLCARGPAVGKPLTRAHLMTSDRARRRRRKPREERRRFTRCDLPCGAFAWAAGEDGGRWTSAIRATPPRREVPPPRSGPPPSPTRTRARARARIRSADEGRSPSRTTLDRRPDMAKITLLIMLAAAQDPAIRAREAAAKLPFAYRAYLEVRREAAAIGDPALRAAVEAQVLAPWLPQQAWAYGHPAEARKLLGDPRLELPPPKRGDFLAAPGGGCENGHHGYPGGLSVHTLATLRSEEHTSELQSPCNLVCRLLLEKKKN